MQADGYSLDVQNMHTDDFYHYLNKGAIPPHMPESNVIDTTTYTIRDTVSAIKEKVASGTALLS